ncbi:hypothetical protein QVD17_09208 [Tagetes erecta]|uniref:Secreted protein n=1 Tax=Tagetes erecta TaxID=13708 RepID=A0AAD8L0J3_TARER|nr:hypothetical protein QVD17_27226 [Tagetes erecta]KAK1432313.1 hypothetical protein QVD17_09208 [Tagetes erecta]
MLSLRLVQFHALVHLLVVTEVEKEESDAKRSKSNEKSTEPSKDYIHVKPEGVKLLTAIVLQKESDERKSVRG